MSLNGGRRLDVGTRLVWAIRNRKSEASAQIANPKSISALARYLIIEGMLSQGSVPSGFFVYEIFV